MHGTAAPCLLTITCLFQQLQTNHSQHSIDPHSTELPTHLQLGLAGIAVIQELDEQQRRLVWQGRGRVVQHFQVQVDDCGGGVVQVDGALLPLLAANERDGFKIVVGRKYAARAAGVVGSGRPPPPSGSQHSTPWVELRAESGVVFKGTAGFSQAMHATAGHAVKQMGPF